VSKTTENLWTAFAGESEANRKYLAFASKADAEGFTQAARLFRAAAAAETVHANNHLKALGEVKSTAENLKTASGGENYEWTSMYPPFLEEATAVGEKLAVWTFRLALAVEKEHQALYDEMLQNLDKSNNDAYGYYVCPTCGHTHPRNAPERCPVCGAKGETFFRVD
jgi:rubrerythrin